MNDEYYAKYGEGIPSPPELPTIPGGNMATLRASAKQDGVNVKDQVTGTILATLKIGWEVDGDMSTARTDLVNIKVYRKGSGFPDITLAKLAKCSLSGLNTPYPIPSIPPPDPEPQVWPPSFILENEVTHARQRYIKE